MSSKKYFRKLNYSLANEDTTLEYEMVKELKPGRTLTVCGSGGRSIPLVAGTTKEVVCTDLAKQQLLLAEHRVATIRTFSYDDFLLYWGFPPYRANENSLIRKQMFERLELTPDCRNLFTEIFDEIEFRGLIYQGSWEKTFTGVPKLLRMIVGSTYDKIFSFNDMESQKKFFDKALESYWWRFLPRLVLRAFGNAAFFNAFLYKGHFVKKNMKGSLFEIYRNAFRSLFYQDLAKNNFFLQLIFLGELRFPEGNPIEAQRAIFDEVKEAVSRVKISYLNEDLLQVAMGSKERFDFVSLSDVPSYFSGDTEREYMQRVSDGLNPGALVVVRCYLREPEEVDLSGFKDVTENYKNLIDAEKTQIYRIFVYQYVGKMT